MSKYIVNALSLNMIAAGIQAGQIDFVVVGLDEAKEFATDATSIVGHPDSAAQIGNDLDRAVAPNRATVALVPGDELLVAQYRGQRLPEGTTRLPEGTSFTYYRVKLT